MENIAFALSVDKSNTLPTDGNNHKCNKTSRGTNLASWAISVPIISRPPGQHHLPVPSLLNSPPQVSEAESLGSKGDPDDFGNRHGLVTVVSFSWSPPARQRPWSRAVGSESLAEFESLQSRCLAVPQTVTRGGRLASCCPAPASPVARPESPCNLKRPCQ